MTDFDSKLWVTIADGPPARVVLMRGMFSVCQLPPWQARDWAERGRIVNLILPAAVCESLRMMADEIEEREMPT